MWLMLFHSCLWFQPFNDTETQEELKWLHQSQSTGCYLQIGSSCSDNGHSEIQSAFGSGWCVCGGGVIH